VEAYALYRLVEIKGYKLMKVRTEKNLDRPCDVKERRRYPRILISLPIDFWMVDESNAGLGMVINASERGLLIQTFNDMPIGKKISIKVSLPKNNGSEIFRVEAEIVLKEMYWLGDWEEYQYGLRFVAISSKDHLKLKLLLWRDIA
jgi:hypothetical protein